MASRRRGWIGIVAGVLVAVLAMLAVGYSWAWYHYAGELKTKAQAGLTRLENGGRQAECEGMRTTGFPLSLSLDCDAFRYADSSRGVAIEAGATRSAAHVYDPLLISGEVAGPATVKLQGMRELHLDWKTLDADTRLGQPLPRHVRIAGNGITAALEDGDDALARAGSAAVEARPEGADLTLKIDFARLVLGERLTRGTELPPLDGAFDATLADGIALLATPPKSARGLSGTVKQARLSSGEAAISVTGPIAIDEKGRISAQLSLKLSKPRKIAALLGKAVPEMREQIDTGFAALAALGDETTLPLRIDKGKAYVGFIKVADLPPVD